ALPNTNLAAVAATDPDDLLWTDSNIGRETVDLAAPGVEVLSTTLEAHGTYRTRTGTSYAAPHVSAAAALLLSIRPSLEPHEVIELLGRTGDEHPDLQATTVHGSRIRADAATVAARFDDIVGLFEGDIIWLV